VCFFALSEGGKKNSVFCPGGKKCKFASGGVLRKVWRVFKNCPRGLKSSNKMSEGGKIVKISCQRGDTIGEKICQRG